MDIRKITDTYYVAPQLDPADLPAIAAAGITRILCNRPDSEVPPSHQAASIEAAAQAAGLEFALQPLTHQTMTPEVIAHNAELAAGAQGAVLAYCASGTRSCIAWCLAQAGAMPTDQILLQARQAGYDLDGLRPALESFSQRG